MSKNLNSKIFHITCTRFAKWLNPPSVSTYMFAKFNLLKSLTKHSLLSFRFRVIVELFEFTHKKTPRAPGLDDRQIHLISN